MNTMKAFLSGVSVICFIFAITCTKNPAGPGQDNSSTVTDIDGNIYQTVKIGNQEWMAENLRVTKYNDGSAILKITDNSLWDNCYAAKTPAFCYFNNTTNADSIRKFGSLYNWYTIKTGKLAPAGWHVSDTADWNILEDYLVANGYNWDSTTSQNRIAKAMASKTDWLPNSQIFTIGIIGNDLTKNNRSGFSALPGGYRYATGDFLNQGDNGFWWIASEKDSVRAWIRQLYSGGDSLITDFYVKSCGFSVRLVKD